jgi:hypothetical protein
MPPADRHAYSPRWSLHWWGWQVEELVDVAILFMLTLSGAHDRVRARAQRWIDREQVRRRTPTSSRA